MTTTRPRTRRADRPERFLPTIRSSGDIAARLRTSSGLRDLEVRYRGIVDRLPAVIYIDGVGPGDPMVDVEPRHRRPPGHHPRGMARHASKAGRTCIHPDDRDRVVDGERARLGDRRALPRSNTAPSIATGAMRVDPRGLRADPRRGRQPAYWLGLMLDVSEDASTPATSCSEAQTKYGALVEQIPAIVYVDVADERMTTTYVSPQIEPLLGYHPAGIHRRPRPVDTMLHPDDRDDAVETYLRGRESGEPFVVRVPPDRAGRARRVVPRLGDRAWPDARRAARRSSRA